MVDMSWTQQNIEIARLLHANITKFNVIHCVLCTHTNIFIFVCVLMQ